MSRKIKNQVSLSPSESERLKRIALIKSEAEQVFGDVEKAKRWITTENIALGSSPQSMLDSDQGAQEVRKILNAIAYGGVV